MNRRIMPVHLSKKQNIKQFLPPPRKFSEANLWRGSLPNRLNSQSVFISQFLYPGCEVNLSDFDSNDEYPIVSTPPR